MSAASSSGLKAFVAASSGGIGYGIAMALARQHGHIVINGRDQPALVRTAKAIGAATVAEVQTWQGDITAPGSAEKLREAFGDFDVLITNAQGPSPAPFKELTRQALLQAFEANSAAMIGLIQNFLPAMRQNGFGRIVNILSTTALRPLDGLDASAAARASLIAALKSIAREAIADGVTINHVLPGPIQTGRTLAYVHQQAETMGSHPGQALESITNKIPAARLGRIEEVGALCAFLCSREAGFITGQSICIDGGLTI